MKTANAMAKLAAAGAKVEQVGGSKVAKYEAAASTPHGEVIVLSFQDFFGEVRHMKVSWLGTSEGGFSSFTEAFDFFTDLVKG